MEGCGTWVWSDGSKYVGGFHGGYFDGHGVISYADGGRFEGEFENSSAFGQAAYTTADGTRITGRFHDIGRDVAHPHSPAHYPFWRAFFGGEANVQMTVIIAADGSVTNAQVDQPTEYPSFDKAAVETVNKWKYLPATIDGHPIKMPYTIIVQFAQAD
jgi:TonB family protein